MLLEAVMTVYTVLSIRLITPAEYSEPIDSKIAPRIHSHFLEPISAFLLVFRVRNPLLENNSLCFGHDNHNSPTTA
jgi:hypothetical protein